MTQPVTNWIAYRKCPICLRMTGNACVSKSGRIVGGQPDGVLTELEHPHNARKLRALKLTQVTA